MRNPRREIEVAGPVRVHALLARLGAEPRGAPGHQQRHVGPGRRRCCTTKTRSRCVPSSPVAPGGDEVPGLPPAGGHRPAAPQRQLLRRAPGQAVPRPGGEGHRRPRHAHAGGAGARGGVGGQGQPGASGTCCCRLGYEADGLYLGLGHRELQRRVSGCARRVRRARAALRCARSPCGTTTATTCRPRRRDPPGAVLVLRPLQASPLRLPRPSTADTTWWPPATTSTTRLRCCSATPCAGTSTTWPASSPCCPARDGFPRKVKPLVRLSERETAAYCVVRGIDYQVEECPMAAGNRHLGYKAALNTVEERSPGTKAAFYLGFLDRMAPLLAAHGREGGRTGGLRPCSRAARRPPARCARSAASSNGRPATNRSGRAPARSSAPATAADERRRRPGQLRLRRQGPGAGRQGSALPRHPEGRRRVPHPRRLLPPRRAGRPARGNRGQGQSGRAVHGAAAHARGLRGRDAPRGAGDLPEGPRPDADDGGHRARRAGPGVGRGLGSAVDDDAAGGRDDRRLRAARGLRQSGPRQRARHSSAPTSSSATGSSCGTATTASTSSDVDRVVLDLPEPWRVVPHAEGALRAGGILVAYTPSIMQAASSGRRSPAPGAGWRPGRSRCSTGRGTSRARPCGRTTAWWPTPAFSPQPASWDADTRAAAGGCRVANEPLRPR